MMPELNKIYQGDCLSIMRGWPDGCVDVVLTDVPYNLFTRIQRNLMSIAIQASGGNLQTKKGFIPAKNR